MAYGYDIAEDTSDSYDPFDLEQYYSDDEDEEDEEDEEEFLQGVADFDRHFPSTPPAATRGRLVLAQIHPTSDAISWAELLQALPGRPDVIVADRAGEIRSAATQLWPSTPERAGPEFVNCRWHLLKNLRGVIVKELVALDTGSGAKAKKTERARQHVLYQKAHKAFDDRRSYADFLELVRASIDLPALAETGNETLSAAARWLKTNELLVTVQQARREQRPGPESTGPLEIEITAMRDRLRRRAQVLRNRPRTNTLLRLMVAGRRGLANERVWTERIRAHLEQLDGVLPEQRHLAERRGASSI
jgi:hypothetical protein